MASEAAAAAPAAQPDGAPTVGVLRQASLLYGATIGAVSTMVGALAGSVSDRDAAPPDLASWGGGSSSMVVSQEQEDALVRIQSIARGHLQQKAFKVEKAWTAEASEESLVAERSRLLAECNAILEKRSRRRVSLGSFEIVAWAERLVVASETALVYQHVKPSAEPTGKRTDIPYSSMRMIKALSNHVLEITCTHRDYHFQLSSRSECVRWANNLVALAAAAGHTVAGLMVVEDSSDASDDEVNDELAAQVAMSSATT
jgi:hypothetical protein